MKLFKTIFFCFLFAGTFLVSCVKDQIKVTFTGGTPPQLSVSSTADLVLMKANQDYTSLQFQWTNPDYTFSNGVNTQDVFYTLQIDTTGSNFSNPNAVGVSITRDVSTSFIVRNLNNTLANLALPDFVVHAFEFRIKATLSGNSVPIYSNVVKINITTYLDVVYPVPAQLFITGSATPGSWQAGTNGEVVPAGQEFTKVNAYLFQIDNLALTFNGTADASNGFLLLPVYGSWAAKYGFTGAKHQNNGLGDSFTPNNGNDFAPPPVSGNYKIVVNFKTGKYTMTKI